MNLADHPNEVIATTNNEEAKELLAQLGVLEKLRDKAAGLPNLPKQVVRLDIRDHQTHWVTALLYVGFERAEDNGFAVRCLPKLKVSGEVFEEQLKREVQQEFAQGFTEQRGDLPPLGTS